MDEVLERLLANEDTSHGCVLVMRFSDDIDMDEMQDALSKSCWKYIPIADGFIVINKTKDGESKDYIDFRICVEEIVTSFEQIEYLQIGVPKDRMMDAVRDFKLESIKQPGTINGLHSRSLKGEICELAGYGNRNS